MFLLHLQSPTDCRRPNAPTAMVASTAIIVTTAMNASHEVAAGTATTAKVAVAAVAEVEAGGNTHSNRHSKYNSNRRWASLSRFSQGPPSRQQGATSINRAARYWVWRAQAAAIRDRRVRKHNNQQHKKSDLLLLVTMFTRKKAPSAVINKTSNENSVS